MPAVTESFSLGMPAQIGKIEKELKKLWAEGEGAMTRASLINLAVYSDKRGSLTENTQLLSRLTENHACRAIVIEADCVARDYKADAWISAHCHVSRAGSKQICSEQISFLLGGPCTSLLPSIVFSHLDSDLPFYLWWQSEFPENVDPLLWSWVDRVIYDSRAWNDFNAQMQRLDTIQAEADQRIVLCDLNWTRLDRIRAAIAQFFDHPAAHHHFNKIEKVSIVFGPGYRSTAMFLAGWLGAQLHWQVSSSANKQTVRFANADKQPVSIELRESPGEAIGEISLQSGATQFKVRHPQGADLLEVTRHDSGETRMDQLMPAGKDDLVSLLSQELMRGGPHAVYLRVIKSMGHLI
jgi:glucose-6-phosphate dehydrogenase assembly protein OpcA